MRINKKKSNAVHFRKHQRPRTNPAFKYGDNEVNILSDYKYLGLILDEHMTFEKAVDTLCSSAGRALASVINTFKSLHNIRFSTFTKLYNSCVNSILEYGSAIWLDKRFTQCNKLYSN